MDRNFFLIVMAAGHGTRMGAKLPKQFLSLSGVPILQRTIQKFIDAVPELQVITVLPPDDAHIAWWKNHCLEKNFSCPQMLVKGGITRFHSVRSALEKVPDGALVAIQDGVRPLLSTELIISMLDSFSSNPGLRALIPVIPTVDTLKMLRRENGALVQCPGPEPDRSLLFGAQTPQFFLSEDIKAAYRQPYDVSFTDDASVASRYEIPLAFCEGERLNFKITSPDDLVLAEAVLKIRGQV
ncbi:MAG: 2-C-methyl-D-erythritol 4-phosphate cytidylyltransferase [Candidatus Cryptobacteroides sp.]|nr:2-C-methyl-D-erythritol 4-phosphate cytidylyltransferase [Bacteroidales bacterium]